MNRKLINRIFAILSAVLLMFLGLILFQVLNIILPLDFSQDYRKVPGIERIVFRDNWSEVYYERCFWGLKKSSVPVEEKHEIDATTLREMGALEDNISDHQIREAVLSPDGNYVLYCEKEYNYTGSGLTDDEYCYYQVYSIDSGETVIIYGGYKEWYDLYWCSE